MAPNALLEQIVVDEAEDAVRRDRFPVGASLGHMMLTSDADVSVLAANRDPGVFAEPLRHDVRRANARCHLSFSFGEHYCLGAHLARLEIRSALERLLALPGLRLVSSEAPAGFAFRRPATLELAWEPA